MVITMQDYKEIRQRHRNGESQRHIAKTMGISRNTVKKYCEGNSVPWERKTPIRESSVLTDEIVDFILKCLKEDKAEGLTKQRHTAKRIYDRLVEELGFTGGESTIRAKVHELKEAHPDAFVPLQFDPGEAMQVDWGEAKVYIDGKRETINIFCRMNGDYSGMISLLKQFNNSENPDIKDPVKIQEVNLLQYDELTSGKEAVQNEAGIG